MEQKQKGEASRRHISGILVLPLLPSRGEEPDGQKKKILPIHILESNSGKNTDFFLLPLKLQNQTQEPFHINPEQGENSEHR